MNLATSGSASGQTAARNFGTSANATGSNILSRGDGFASLSRRCLLGARVRLVATANAVHRMSFGKLASASGGVVGDLIGKGFGWQVSGTGALELQVHDGTNLTNVSSSFTPTSGTAFDVVVENVGNGTVNLYVNDLQVATSSAGGSGAYTSVTIPVIWAETELTGAITTATNFIASNISLGPLS
jgi:hypothetical protein